MKNGHVAKFIKMNVKINTLYEKCVAKEPLTTKDQLNVCILWPALAMNINYENKKVIYAAACARKPTRIMDYCKEMSILDILQIVKTVPECSEYAPFLPVKELKYLLRAFPDYYFRTIGKTVLVNENFLPVEAPYFSEEELVDIVKYLPTKYHDVFFERWPNFSLKVQETMAIYHPKSCLKYITDSEMQRLAVYCEPSLYNKLNWSDEELFQDSIINKANFTVRTDRVPNFEGRLSPEAVEKIWNTCPSWFLRENSWIYLNEAKIDDITLRDHLSIFMQLFSDSKFCITWRTHPRWEEWCLRVAVKNYPYLCSQEFLINSPVLRGIVRKHYSSHKYLFDADELQAYYLDSVPRIKCELSSTKEHCNICEETQLLVENYCIHKHSDNTLCINCFCQLDKCPYCKTKFNFNSLDMLI